MLLISLLISPANGIYLSMTAALCHFVIDAGKFFYLKSLISKKKKTPEKERMILIYKPMDRPGEMKRNRNAGRLIGTLERIIMLILISRGQYSAAGFVLTAKSIARYDRISKDQDFAEYYLLGTLMSTAGAIFCSRLLII